MWGFFFGEFQCLPLDDCPAASRDSGVLARGSESTSFYSTILVEEHIPPLFVFDSSLSFIFQGKAGRWAFSSVLSYR